MKHLKRGIEDARLFSLVNAGSIRVTKRCKAVILIISKIFTALKFLFNLRANLITNMTSLKLTFHPHTERQTKRAVTWCKTLAEFTEWH